MRILTTVFLHFNWFDIMAIEQIFKLKNFSNLYGTTLKLFFERDPYEKIQIYIYIFVLFKVGTFNRKGEHIKHHKCTKIL